MVVKVGQLLNADYKKVWHALTNPEQMKKWYFSNLPDFRAEVGFTTKFKMFSGERVFSATWRVSEVIPEKQITYVWSYDEYEGEGPVTFKLEPRGTQTYLTVINKGLDSFPQDIPEFKKESCTAGWEYFLKKSLPGYIENQDDGGCPV